MNRSPYSDNPFDNMYEGARSVPGSGSSIAKPMAPGQSPGATNLDDLINPFAVLGMENKAAPKAPSAAPSQAAWASQGQPTGAGWASPTYQQQPPVMPPQQLQMQWGPSPQSAFQPVSAPGGSVSPYNSGSPAMYAPPPVSPTMMAQNPGVGSPAPFGVAAVSMSPAALQPGYASPSSFQQQQQMGGLSKPAVTDADLSLFSAPVKTPPKVSPATSPVPHDHHMPPPPPPAEGVWAQPVSPKPNDGWDNDDFGISWGQSARASGKAPEESGAESPASARSPEPQTPVKASPAKSPTPAEAALGDHKTEGEILARISVRTLIVKEWKPTWWIITGGKMLLYRSKEDYLYNPVGVMVKKDIPLRDNLRCSEVTCKPYKGYGDLYHFTLEEMLDYGPSLIAKFASTDVKAVRELRAVVIGYIVAERKKRVQSARSALPQHHGESHEGHRSSPTPGPAAEEGDKYAKWGNIN